jgi:hypothetical protein
MSLPKELWTFQGAANYKHRAPTELNTVSDDNPPELRYKGKSEQISNPLIAYARLIHIRTRIRFCLRLRRVDALRMRRRALL